MSWKVEYINEFEELWTTLTMEDQATIDRAVQELAERDLHSADRGLTRSPSRDTST